MVTNTHVCDLLFPVQSRGHHLVGGLECSDTPGLLSHHDYIDLYCMKERDSHLSDHSAELENLRDSCGEKLFVVVIG